MLFLFNAKHIEASSASNVSATVKISVCGGPPFIIENGEECERNGDLNGKTCVSLGYASGTLACDTSCSFDTSNCVAPSINPANVAPENTSSLLATGYLSKPPSDNITSVSSLTATTPITINIPTSGGTDSVVLPDNLVITKSDGANFDPTNLTAADVSSSSLSGFSSGVTVDGALQWGISSTTLEFNAPITLNIYVGTSLNSQTLNVVRSTSLDSGWTTDGIVSPATCTVSAGLCTFQATKASYFATTRTGVSSTGSSTTSSASSSNSSSDSTASTSGPSTQTTTSTSMPAPIVTTIFRSKVNLPSSLIFFDIDRSGKIELSELFSAVKSWVGYWREALIQDIALAKGEATPTKEARECDVNQDRNCDLKDLSILLFYVGS